MEVLFGVAHAIPTVKATTNRGVQVKEVFGLEEETRDVFKAEDVLSIVSFSWSSHDMINCRLC